MVFESSKELFIQGVTADGRTFRPSDWAERLCGVMRCFERDTVGYNHITYSQYVRPTLWEGVKSVIVHDDLEKIRPEAYRFFLDFASDNNLQTTEFISAELEDF